MSNPGDFETRRIALTPNLTSARQAIQAELSHARQGAAFYSARVEALETALTQLESVESDDLALLDTDEDSKTTRTATKKRAGKRGRPARKAESASGSGRKAASDAPTRARKGKKAASRDDQGELPTTGADFWLELVTDEPKSAVDIANAAAAHLGLGDDQKTQIQKLKQRVAPALATLVATQKIQHAGTGRQRRYFLGNARQAAE
jgi:hypothetical protein